MVDKRQPRNEWELLENGFVIERFPSRNKAKNAMHWKIKEAEADWLDLSYKIRKVEK